MEMMRYRPPSNSPEANRPWEREWVVVRLSREELEDRGVYVTTVLVVKESVSAAAPQAGQKRPAGESSLPQAAH